MREENPAAPEIHIDLGARLDLLIQAYGADATVPDLLETMVARLEDLSALTHSIGLARKDDSLLGDADNYSADAAFLHTLLR